MSDNEELYEKALEAINNLYSDQSVSREKALRNLQGLSGEIDIMVNALGDDDE